MQNPVICAFRARLKFLGYTEVSIKRKKFIDQELYCVSAIDPLFGIRSVRYMDIIDMYNWR